MTLASPDPALDEPLTVKLGDLCSGPLCSNGVTGKARHCSQRCRNNAHALRRVREMIESLPDHEALRVIRG